MECTQFWTYTALLYFSKMAPLGQIHEYTYPCILIFIFNWPSPCIFSLLPNLLWFVSFHNFQTIIPVILTFKYLRLIKYIISKPLKLENVGTVRKWQNWENQRGRVTQSYPLWIRSSSIYLTPHLRLGLCIHLKWRLSLVGWADLHKTFLCLGTKTFAWIVPAKK